MAQVNKKANIFRYATFNVDALLQLARGIRQLPCWCDESQTPKCGSFNWVIFITFDDGVEWVFRVPKHNEGYGLGSQTIREMLASEAATMILLREKSNVPVPEVFSYRSASYLSPTITKSIISNLHLVQPSKLI